MTTSVPALGRLERVELREVWAGEASHFSLWLAAPIDLALLGEAISPESQWETREEGVRRRLPFRQLACRSLLTDGVRLVGEIADEGGGAMQDRPMLDRSLTLPAYTYVDAARYALIPVQTVRNWFRGARSPGHTMRAVFGDVPTHGLSYLQLVEVAFVAEMRAHKLKLSALRTAYEYVRTALGVDYPFAQERFLTDGTGLFIHALDDADQVISASRPGQRAWREAIEICAQRFDYINHLALRWHPRGRDFRIVIDPRISFGRPVVEDTGVPTAAIHERRLAGEDLDFIAHDFGLTREQVKDALWFETLNHAA